MDVHQDLQIGVGILKVLLGQRITWNQMLKEFIDNSLGARANNVAVRRKGDIVEIVDDGEGCEDLRMMESLAKSIKTAHNKAQMYGIGGVMSQISASQGGLVEVESVHKNKSSQIAVHWRECIEQERFATRFYDESPAAPGVDTGTTIRIHNALRFQSVEKLADDLGFAYSKELRRGKQITFDVNGKLARVEPFRAPPHDARVNLDFEWDGHRIRGFCILIPPEHSIREAYQGWNVFWGYRFAFNTRKPAGDRRASRIYAEINLPASWKNITPTKDDFTTDADGFWEKVAELCGEIIDEAEDQSTEIELHEATSIAAEMLTGAICGEDRKVKGRRPGVAGNEGAVEPTGLGSPHRNFGDAQPGPKDADPRSGPLGVKAPSKIKIFWESSLEYLYMIEIRTNAMLITLDAARPEIYQFRDEPEELAVLCAFPIAQHLVSRDCYKNMFPSLVGENFRDTLDCILSRLKAKVPAPA